MAAITTRVKSASVAGAGTITCTTSSPTVTGSGTSFTTAVIIGQQLTNSSGTLIGTVLTVDSNTQITLVANAAVAVTAGTYNIVSTGITTKNSPLTNDEIDTNFININNAVVAGANSSTNNTPNTLVKRDQSGGFSAGAINVTSVTSSGVTYPTTNATQAQMEAGTDTTTRYMTPNNVYQAINVLALQSIGNLTKDMTGFESMVGSNITYNAATRTISLNRTADYNVWYRGKKSVITSTLTLQLSAQGGVHWIGINPTTLALEEFLTDTTIFTDTILVAVVYLNSTYDTAVIIGDERHTAARDTQSHAAQHNTLGAIWKSGGQMTYTLNNDSATTLNFSTPIYLVDEDLTHTISHSATPNGYLQQILTGTASLPTIYMSGQHYTQTAESTTPWLLGTSNTARYNSVISNSGSLADAPNNSYINYWIVLTNDTYRPVKAIMGKSTFTNVNDAYAEQFNPGTLPFPEVALMYRVTLFTNTSYAGNKVRIISVKTIDDQQSSALKTYETMSHSMLANTTSSDDHTQYVHISNARTITAGHTFNGNNTFGGTNTFSSIVYMNGSFASNLLPNSNAAYDLGSSSVAWRNIYTNDLHLSNEGHESGNVVDGTRGNWTIQEGETNLYIINNKNGKKYKFSLEEIK